MKARIETEVHVVLLQDADGKWFWAVVVDRCGSDEGPDLIGRYPNSMAARDAAWLTAQRLGGTVVYPRRKERS
jgi:hypothetical protein